jgi:hypothetical protein
MSKTILLMTVIALAAVLSLFVAPNAFAAKSSDEDSGGSDDKPKSTSDASGHKTKGDSSNEPKHGGLPVPGMPVTGVDRHKDKDEDRDSGGGLPVPGILAHMRTDGDDGSEYNNNNIKKFDTSKSIFRSAGSSHGSKVIEYMPGFNETFYNSTLPYCYAVISGSCYDSSTGQ